MSIDRTPWATPAGEDVMAALDACVLAPTSDRIEAARAALAIADVWPTMLPWPIQESIRAARTAVEAYDAHARGA